MKFICLHGAIGNASNYRVQLDPICKTFEADGAASFFFVSGTVPSPEPPGFEGYFGPGPHFRHIDDFDMAANAMVDRIRQFPDCEKPEDALRALIPHDVKTNGRSPANIRPLLDSLYAKMDEEGDVDGVLGYSEGALIAATLLLEDERRVTELGLPRRLKAGVFFAGWPPMDPRTGHVILADENESLRINVPTVHVIGSEDPYLDGSKALYNVCNEETAVIFDHAKGHTLPRDARTFGELGVTIRETMALATAAC